uniref:Uncharacterized protein n=1 Tax=Anopheles culicifacies TaxID=139723 RepID=A0A182MLE7_9DIPT
MSILLQETGGGNSGNGTVTAPATTANEDELVDSSLAVDIAPIAMETCTGDCHYGRNWKEYVELLAHLRVLDVDEGETEKQHDELCSENNSICTGQPVPSECHEGNGGSQQKLQHSENVFPLNCCCRMCNASREVVMKLYAEDCQYNSLWDRLQLLMKQYYDLIPESEDNALYNQYMELMSKSSLKWLTDLRFSRNNIIQISLASNLPLSNEMAFVMLTNVLSTRDPHQLFELLCFQLRSIVQVYYVGFEDLVTENPEDGTRQFNAPEVLNYIVNGYKKLRQSARTVTPLLNVLEQCHLGKFGLTWWLINQRIFQRYFYYEVQSIVPDCMNRMRGTIPEREYQELVARFLKFDKEMADIALSWVDVWPLLYEYHRSPEDCERRNRIRTVHALLQSIRGARYTPKAPELFEMPERPIAEWMELKSRTLVWEYVVHCLKTKWIPGVSSRLTNVADVVKCPGCDLPLNTHNMVCACLSCIIGGGIFPYRPKKEVNERYGMCICANMIEMLLESQGKPVPASGDEQKGPNVHELLSSSLLLAGSEAATQNGCVNAATQCHDAPQSCDDSKQDEHQDATTYLPLIQSLSEDDELYHIAWAIFKHLPDRVPYRWNTLEPSRFCTFQASPCSSIACRVAVNIIAMNYPIHLSRLLIHSYKPVSEEPRRIMKGNWNTKARNSLRKLCSKRWQEEMDDQMHPLRFVDMFWSLQNSTLNLPKTRASDLAEWFMLDTQAPPRNVFYQYFTKFFHVKDDDIAFDVEGYERDRERSVSPNRMRESLMQKLETHSALVTTPCPGGTLATSASSGSSSSSSSSSCLSSSNSSSSSSTSSCSFSTASAASVAAAAAAAAAAASTFIEPMVNSSVSNGSTTERKCTCICNSCVTEFLSQSETMSKQFDPLASDSLTQRTNMLEMELKALLKERNMLLEKGGHMNPACKRLNRDDSCTAKVIDEPSKGESVKGVECEEAKSSIPISDLGSVRVTEVTDVSDDTEQRQIIKPQDETVIASSCVATKTPATVTAISTSKASLNESNPKTTCTSSHCSQPRCDTPQTTAVMSNAELQTPAKLSAFAQLAASKLPPSGDSTPAKTSTPKQEGVAPSANSACSLKPKSLPAAQSQTGNGNRPVTNPNPPPPAAAATQTHSTSKPCPCGMPSHTPGAKVGTVSKARSANGTTTQGSTTSASATHSKEDHKKSCHRGTAPPSASGGDKAEGSCVCYYCTLFGQSECNHNQRTNETREKLRKKLQSKQEQKSLSTNGTAVAKDQNVVPSKKAASNDSIPPAGKARQPLNTASSSATNNSKTVVADKGNKKGKQSTPNTSSNGKANRFQSIDDLLRFIEGDDTSKEASNTPAKGSAKRQQTQRAKSEQKQSANSAMPAETSTTLPTAAPGKDADKIKKAKLNKSLKLIADLEVLRQRFYDCQKQEQKTLPLLEQPGLSKKERKELLLKIQIYRQQKNELHTAINGLVTSIRSEVPEYMFKLEAFAAAPSPCCTGPHQLGQPNAPAPDVQQVGRQVVPGAMLPPPPSNLTSTTKHAQLHESINNLKHKQQQQQQSQMRNNHFQQLKQQMQPHVGLNESASQQLVTIKRTFLPHPQPQITVTAKGDSPDQDQILYTFINGQMVPVDPSNHYHKTGKLYQQTKDGPVAIDKAKLRNTNDDDDDPLAHMSHLEGSGVIPCRPYPLQQQTKERPVVIDKAKLQNTNCNPLRGNINRKRDDDDPLAHMSHLEGSGVIPCRMYQQQQQTKERPVVIDKAKLQNTNCNPLSGNINRKRDDDDPLAHMSPLEDSFIMPCRMYQQQQQTKERPVVIDKAKLQNTNCNPLSGNINRKRDDDDPLAHMSPLEDSFIMPCRMYQQQQQTKERPVVIDKAKLQNTNCNPLGGNINRKRDDDDPLAHMPHLEGSGLVPVHPNDPINQMHRIRESKELIRVLQTDHKGNPEILSLVRLLKKDLLKMQKNSQQLPQTDTAGNLGATTKSNAPLNNQATKRNEPVNKPISVSSSGQAGSKGKAPVPSVEPVIKAKVKKEHKKDKMIDEIDEIVARLNLLDSDEEDAKPASKKKQKSSSASQAKVPNRKQSKDSIVSSSSGNAPAVQKQPTKSQSKQQQTPKCSETQESQKKKNGKSEAERQKAVKQDKPILEEKAINKDKGKAQSQQQARTVDCSVATAVETTTKIIVRKKAPKTFIDPEFDNNAFRLLNMDDSESEIEEEEEIPEVETITPVQEEKTPTEQCKPVAEAKQQEQLDKASKPVPATAQKGKTVKEKKSTEKKATKQEKESKQQQKRDAGKKDAEATTKSAASTTTTGNDSAELRPKKQTPAQAMVEKISALLDSPGLSNRQRKQMIRQLEQAQATIQSQLLQNAAKATKAKVQAQAQQEKMANQMASGVGNNASASKPCAEKEAKNKTRQAAASVTCGSAINDSQTSSSASGARNSLMEQLKRGIRAEGLDLPPGITLTRLDAIQAEALRLKRESIRKLSVPLKPVTPPLDTRETPMLPGSFGAAGSSNAGMFVVNPMAPLSMPGQQDSVIMVNTGNLRTQEQQSNLESAQNGSDRKKRNKRRKNKGKDLEQSEQGVASLASSISTGTEGMAAAGQLVDGSNIVTLRNPMFHSGPMGMGGVGMHPPGGSMMSDVQGARATLGYDQPAKIFKNDNGMFTIRNPALHHAVSGGAPPEVTGFRPFNAAYLVENGIMPPSGSMHQPIGTVPHITAAVSAGSSTIIPGSSSVPGYLQQYPSPALDESMGPRKCKSVIGSEMKNAQKQKQNSLQQQGGIGGGLTPAPGRSWQHMNGGTGQDIFSTPSSSPSSTIGESHYSSFNHYNLSGQDMIHGGPGGTSGRYGSGMLGPPGYYHSSGNGTSALPKGTPNVNAIGSERSHGLSYLGGAEVSGSLATHCCDDEAPSAYFNGNSLGSLASGGMSSRTRYDDLAFLQNLQPGQRLNSEVTIHSINESKMRRQQAQNYTHDIQITAIPAPSPPAAGRAGLGGVPATSSAVSLQHLMQQTHQAHLQQQQPMPDTQLHLSDLSPGSGSVGSGSGSGTRTGVTLTDFMDSRVSGGSSSSTSADLLKASLELDAKNFLRDYQLGQLQQQMQDLQLQSQQAPREYGDNMFATKQPKANVREQESDEQDLESLDRLNYFLAASGGNSSNVNGMTVIHKPNDPNASVATSSTTATAVPTNSSAHGVEDGNPGGVSIGGEELQRPQQPPIGTPSSKNLQQHRLQQNGTPVSTAGSVLYPATADSPASSVSMFDGISSSLSSQAHSFDDLYTGLLATASPPTSISGSNESTGCNTSIVNSPLNIHQLPLQVSTDTGYSTTNVNGLSEASVGVKSVDNVDTATSLSNK